MKRLDWDTIVMKMEIKWARIRWKFWSKICVFAGNKALEAVDDSKSIANEIMHWYPELRHEYDKIVR